MGSFVDHDSSYQPDHLRLSNAMRARIEKGELDGQKVRELTSELFKLCIQLPRDRKSELEPFVSRAPYVQLHQRVIDYYRANRSYIDVMAADSDGLSLLSYAIDYAPLPVIEDLINDGAATNAVDNLGNNALILAMSQRPELRPLHQFTMDAGCNPYQLNFMRRYNTVSSSLIGERLDQLKWLLSQGINAQGTLIECSPSDAHYPIWIDLHNKHYNLKEALGLLSEHYDNELVDLQDTDSGEKFRQIVIKSKACHHILDHLESYETIWQTFTASRDVARLQTRDLIGFSNIGKLDEALDYRLWKGHEEMLVEHLSHFAPFLIEEVLNRHPWITQHLSAESTPKPALWTERIEHGTETTRGKS